MEIRIYLERWGVCVCYQAGERRAPVYPFRDDGGQVLQLEDHHQEQAGEEGEYSKLVE